MGGVVHFKVVIVQQRAQPIHIFFLPQPNSPVIMWQYIHLSTTFIINVSSLLSLMIHTRLETKGCLYILLKSQDVHFYVQFFHFNHCVVINMHWKVLCFCKSHRSLICCVLMYSIHSGLFSWANLAMCQPYICALTK